MTEKNKTDLASDANSLLANNTSQQISPTDVRQRFIDLIDSTINQLTNSLLQNGIRGTVTNDGTKSSGTYTPTLASGGPFKKIINGGNFTLAPVSPSSNEGHVIDVTIVNNASAGTITTSGFDQVTGDAFTTTNGHIFECRISVKDSAGTQYSTLDVVALQ